MEIKFSDITDMLWLTDIYENTHNECYYFCLQYFHCFYLFKYQFTFWLLLWLYLVGSWLPNFLRNIYNIVRTPLKEPQKGEVSKLHERHLLGSTPLILTKPKRSWIEKTILDTPMDSTFFWSSDSHWPANSVWNSSVIHYKLFKFNLINLNY